MKRNVTVFIPACNEEENIGELVSSIFLQNNKYYILKNIVVVSDGSTDKTVDVVKKIKSKKIILIEGKKRKGKIVRQNEIYKSFHGDILVQFDADTQLGSKSVIDELVKPFLTKKVDTVCGIAVAAKPTTFAEQISYFGYTVFERCKSMHKDPIRYHVTGQIRAFNQKFLADLDLPAHKKDIMEDTYMYYWAIQTKKNIVLNKKAFVYFRLPSTISDYSKQMKRFLRTPDFMDQYFGNELVAKLDVITVRDRLTALVVESLKKPHIALCYVVLHAYVSIVARFSVPDATWELVTSSKKFAKKNV